jgi:UDP-glucuronate 4-epimerase
MASLVTGAAGFIGFNVARRLMDRGDSVVGIDNVNDYYSVKLKRDRLARLAADYGDLFRFVEVDFADAAALNAALGQEEFDRIVHLGAQAGVRYSIENPGAYVQSNLVGHLNLMEVARHRKSSHLVYASSSSVYGGNKELPFRVEERVDRPLSLYAATKKSGRADERDLRPPYRLPQTGLRFFTGLRPWGRPTWRCGCSPRPSSTASRSRCSAKGNMRRDFTYIDDIVTGVVACARQSAARRWREKGRRSKAPHRLYNIGNNTPKS